MIFQGAPGAGKTALKSECMEAVRLHSTPEEPWVAVPVKPGSLKSAHSVIKTMMEKASQELDRLASAFPGCESTRMERLKEVGENLLTGLKKLKVTFSIGALGVTRHGETEGSRTSQFLSADHVFGDASAFLENMRLVIFVDEAQNIPVSESTKEVVSCLHEGVEGLSLLAAFFGLSNTQEVLRQCGLSRFSSGRVVALETLPHEATVSAIQGVFDAYEFNGPDRSTWVDELTGLSQGWPQHINRVTVAAGRVIRDHGRGLQPELLPQTLKLGREMKEQYYASRLNACSLHPRVYKQLAVAAADRNGALGWDEIFDLTESIRIKRDLSMEDFLLDALHAGVLMEMKNRPKDYEIPIPSFADYLRELPVDAPLA